MGAFQVTVMLHDDEVMRFVAAALDESSDLSSDARYVGLRIADHCPEIVSEIDRLAALTS